MEKAADDGNTNDVEMMKEGDKEDEEVAAAPLHIQQEFLSFFGEFLSYVQ